MSYLTNNNKQTQTIRFLSVTSSDTYMIFSSFLTVRHKYRNNLISCIYCSFSQYFLLRIVEVVIYSKNCRNLKYTIQKSISRFGFPFRFPLTNNIKTLSKYII